MSHAIDLTPLARSTWRPLLPALLLAVGLVGCAPSPKPPPEPAPVEASEPSPEVEVQPEQVDDDEVRAAAERGIQAEAAWLAEAELEPGARRELEASLAKVRVAVDESDWAATVELNEQFLRSAGAWGLLLKSCWVTCGDDCKKQYPNSAWKYAACYWGCIAGCHWD